MRVKTVLLASLLLTPLVILLDWEVLTWNAWWLLIWLSIPVVGIVLLLVARVKKQPRLVSVGVAIVFSGMLGAVVARQGNLSQIEANKELGAQVAAALEKHWGASGAYPHELGELVPEFLESVPVPTIGLFTHAPFWYMPSERQGDFVIGYQAIRGIALMRTDAKWAAVPLPW